MIVNRDLQFFSQHSVSCIATRHHHNVFSLHEILILKLYTLLFCRLTVLHVTLLTIGAILIILFFGLHPKTLSHANGVTWSPHEKSLRFEPPGIAFVDDLHLEKQLSPSTGLTLHLSYAVADVKKTGFRPLFMLHNGSDHNQLSLWHWGAALIVMNGDDYSYEKKEPRISLKDAARPGERVEFTLTSNTSGTYLYKNGIEVAKNHALVLTLPSGEEKTRLVLGNSIYGRHGWKGELYSIVLYNKQLPPKELLHLVNHPIDTPHLFMGAKDALLLYTFKHLDDRYIRDESGNNHALYIPPKPLVIKKTLLAFPGYYSINTHAFYLDIILNLLGFIPLGAIVYIWLYRTDFSLRAMGPSTLIFCFLLSLFIEISQAWLPARSSSLLDIILNTSGGLIGILVISSISSKMNITKERMDCPQP